jgi:hypothetical protein
MSLMVESIVDGGMDVEKPLRGRDDFEPLHQNQGLGDPKLKITIRSNSL